MAAAGHPGEDAGLYEAVKAVGEELCPALEIAIPVGKDSMSMKTQWQDDGEDKSVTAPLSLVITAFGAVKDKTVTPQLSTDDDNVLLYVDLSRGQQRLGGSCLAQVYGQLGNKVPDVDEPKDLRHFFDAIQTLHAGDLLQSYHDVSDGGLVTTLLEMAFAGHCGVNIQLDDLPNIHSSHAVNALFAEELGAVLQVRKGQLKLVEQVFEQYALSDTLTHIGQAVSGDEINITLENDIILADSRMRLRMIWAETTHQMQRLRDNPVCADEEHASKQKQDDPGLHALLTYDIDEDICAPYIATGARPEVAILREQGVNSHHEMAAAFDRAGFTAIDVHMSDILTGRKTLERFAGMAVCGGFSYGDVLGAGEGGEIRVIMMWLKLNLANFFARENTFTLGVCNGCQMLSNLHSIIPGTEHWPHFVQNLSARFEARVAMVEVQESPSILLAGMAGSRMPIAVSHGEGMLNLPRKTLCKQLNHNKK